MTRRVVAPLALTALTALAVAQPAQADSLTSTSAAEAGPKPIALVISGGVSLGVYEAGFLYLLVETLKRHPERTDLRLFTGASAGSANALISLVESCSPPNRSPSSGLGWKAWMDVGLDDLFRFESVTEQSLFSREPAERALEYVWDVWKQGLPETCDEILGVTVTRVDKYRVRVSDDLFIPRIEEKFVVRIRGRGMGKPPGIENYVDERSQPAQPLLALRSDFDAPGADRFNFDQLSSVIFASGAFPIAFASQAIGHCMSDPSELGPQMPGTPVCESPDHVERFVDGGVIDNNPLRLASQIAKHGLRTDPNDPHGRVRWRDRRADGANPMSRVKTRFIYIDPDTMAYPTLEVNAGQDQYLDRGVIGVVAQMASDFIVTARAKELYTLVEEDQTLGANMRTSISNYPKAGEELNAFMGFFERELRRFDFYLGMYDAYKQISRGNSEFSLEIERALDELSDDPADEEWRPFACMMSWYEPDRFPLRSNCDSPSLHDFMILLQASIDRLYSHCRQLDARQLAVTLDHPHCRRAASGAAPPEITGVGPIPIAEHWRGKGESTLEHFIRLLEAYEFWFQDLGLDRDEAKFGRIKIRRKVLKMVTAIADIQPSSGDRTILLTAGRAYANNIAYEPPKDWMYVTVGTAIEVGASLLPFDWNRSWARLNLALQMKHLSTLFTQEDVRLTLTPAVGPEFELLPITTSFVQPMLGLRVGYQFGAADLLATKECTSERALGDKRNCSQLMFQSYVAVAFIERIRLQFLVEIFPQSFDFDDASYDFQFGVGAQFF